MNITHCVVNANLQYLASVDRHPDVYKMRVLRMTVAAGIVVRVYTYIDRDPVNRKIARHVLLQLQLQHQKLILQSAIVSFDRMYMP